MFQPPLIAEGPSMSLSTNDVQQILEAGIIQGKMAPADIASNLASTLATAVTPGLNAIIGTQTGLISTVSTAAPAMSITEALAVRDAIASAIENTSDAPAITAERLLQVGYIDVPSILAMAREDAQAPEPPATTGSHAASVDPGNVQGITS